MFKRLLSNVFQSLGTRRSIARGNFPVHKQSVLFRVPFVIVCLCLHVDRKISRIKISVNENFFARRTSNEYFNEFRHSSRVVGKRILFGSIYRSVTIYKQPTDLFMKKLIVSVLPRWSPFGALMWRALTRTNSSSKRKSRSRKQSRRREKTRHRKSYRSESRRRKGYRRETPRRRKSRRTKSARRRWVGRIPIKTSSG